MDIISRKVRLPTICALCNQYHREPQAICAHCRALLLPLGPACQHCALPLPASNYMICGHCIQKKPDIDQTIAACHFKEPLRTLLHAFKYHDGLYLTSFLATLILDAIPTNAPKPQCFLPVPMHPKRLRQRGFNQSVELAKCLSHALKIPYNVTHCKKTINTAPQAGLNAAQRRTNLKQAFHAKTLPYQHITLIDDLLTTGSTANELANVLKNNGATRVDLWCCARV